MIAQARQDERELADLRQAGGDDQGGLVVVAEGADQAVGGQRLADDDDRRDRQHRQRIAEQHAVVEQHPHRDEEQHRESVTQRQGLLRRPLAQLALGQDHPGEEGAERERDAEQHRGAEGEAQRYGEHGQPEQLARAGVGHPVQQPGHDLAPDDQHEGDEGGDLGQGDAERLQPGHHAARGFTGQRPGQRGQQHQGQDHGQVLDDQPADGDAALVGLHQPPLLQRPQQHDGRGDRQRQAEHDPGHQAPAEEMRQSHAEEGRHRHLADRARDGDLADRQQVLEREVQPDAEHQQDDADLRQFLRQMSVSDETRRERSDDHPRQQIAHQRRDLQALGDGPQRESDNEACDYSGDQRGVMGHGSPEF